jgi:hypothetical protein
LKRQLLDNDAWKQCKIPLKDFVLIMRKCGGIPVTKGDIRKASENLCLEGEADTDEEMIHYNRFFKLVLK